MECFWGVSGVSDVQERLRKWDRAIEQWGDGKEQEGETVGGMLFAIGACVWEMAHKKEP